MKYKKQFAAVLVAILATIGVLNAQEKYAVIITSDNNAVNVPGADQWNNGQGMGQYGFDEFWNDAYLFWEMLYTEKGYTDENIFVLYDDGFDLTFEGQWDRYQSYPNYQIENITDQAATKANVQNLFTNTLASLVTQDDFLYVWVMGHGGNTQSDNDGDAYFYLQNGEKVYDYELGNWAGNINAHRKVFHFQVPKGGGFINNIEGDNTYIYTSCDSGEPSYRADDNPVVENEVISGITYNHGEFNFHTYSATNGETPDYSTTYNNLDLSLVNKNDDHFVSFGEVFEWHESYYTTSETPLSSGEIEYFSAADYPTIVYTDIIEETEFRGLIGFDNIDDDDLLRLWFNHATIANNAKAVFFGGTKLYIKNPGVLTIGDNVELSGFSGASGILDFHEIYVGKNVYFHAEPNCEWGGLVVAEDKTLFLEDVTFEDCYLIPNTFGLDLNNCSFTRSGIRPFVQNISVSNSQFISSWIDVSRPDLGSSSGHIYNCTLTDPDGILDFKHGIYLWGYDSYSVRECNVDGFNGDGIRLTGCGSDVNSKNLVENNTILNNAQWWSAGAFGGLTFIHSYSTVHNNYIENNDRGIVSLANSSISLYGDKPIVTQKVVNNTINQIWASGDSFPFKFKYNEMHGTNNPPYHIVYMGVEQDIAPKDITYNCWGNSFDPSNAQAYFFPIDKLLWDPIWNCGGEVTEIIGDDQLLFESAQSNVDNLDYFVAGSDYKLLIENYPESTYASAALKELYRLEKEVGDDYNALQSYYESNQVILANNDLKNTAYKLAVDCEVREESYMPAIEMLEELMADPTTSYEDSLYAIVELGYIYYLMENGNGKSSQVITSPQTKFVSRDLLDENTNNRLSLYFKGDVRKGSLEQNIQKLKNGELLQNVPNPFTGSTEIYYKLNLQSEALINVKVYSCTGQLIEEFNEGKKGIGVHHTIFNADGQIPGIYYYILEINGKISDSKKMVIMN